MSWVRLDDAFADHPKIVGLSPAAVALHVWALCYCSRHLTDGFVPAGAIKSCPWGSTRTARTLVDARLWALADDGYRIPDYLEYNPDAATVHEQRRLKKERQTRWLKRKKDGDETRLKTGRKTTPPPPPPKARGGEAAPLRGAPSTKCEHCGTGGGRHSDDCELAA